MTERYKITLGVGSNVIQPGRAKIVLDSKSGILQSSTPQTIRSGGGGSIKSLEDILDVDEVDVSEGSTVVYNQSTDKYEIKKLDADELSGDFNLDCGEF